MCAASELHDAYAAREAARELLQQRANDLRRVARASGLGPSALAEELGVSTSAAFDLLKASEAGRLERRGGRRRKPVGPSVATSLEE